MHTQNDMVLHESGRDSSFTTESTHLSEESLLISNKDMARPTYTSMSSNNSTSSINGSDVTTDPAMRRNCCSESNRWIIFGLLLTLGGLAGICYSTIKIELKSKHGKDAYYMGMSTLICVIGLASIVWGCREDGKNRELTIDQRPITRRDAIAFSTEYTDDTDYQTDYSY